MEEWGKNGGRKCNGMILKRIDVEEHFRFAFLWGSKIGNVLKWRNLFGRYDNELSFALGISGLLR